MGVSFDEAEERLRACYDVDVTSRVIQVAAPPIRLRVLECGDGPPLVLLHGAGAFALQWLPLLPHLRGLRVIAPDMPGRGRSDRFSYRGIDIREHSARLLEGLFDALGLDDAIVAGSSLGGYRALALAHEAPERVRALCLFGSPALVLDNRDAPLAARAMSLPGVSSLLLKLSSEKSERSMWETFAGVRAVELLPPEFVSYSYREGRLPGSSETITTLFSRVFAWRGYRDEPRWTEAELRRITTPSTLVWGRHDRFGSVELGTRVAAALPDARLEVLDAGHIPFFDDPARCAELIHDLATRAASG